MLVGEEDRDNEQITRWWVVIYTEPSHEQKSFCQNIPELWRRSSRVRRAKRGLLVLH